MATDPYDIVKAISNRAISSRFPKTFSMNSDLKPWSGTDTNVSNESNEKYFFMDISYWEENLDTGESDLVGE